MAQRTDKGNTEKKLKNMKLTVGISEQKTLNKASPQNPKTGAKKATKMGAAFWGSSAFKKANENPVANNVTVANIDQFSAAANGISEAAKQTIQRGARRRAVIIRIVSSGGMNLSIAVKGNAAGKGGGFLLRGTRRTPPS